MLTRGGSFLASCFLVLFFLPGPLPALAAENAAASPQDSPKHSGLQVGPRAWLTWKEGLKLEALDGKFKMKGGAELQADAGVFDLDPSIEEEFGSEADHAAVRRARLYLSGSIASRFHFKTEWDFTGSDGAVIKNNYLEIRDLPVIQRVCVGYFQEPFSLNQVTTNTATLFMERSLANTLAPRHNAGVEINSAAFHKRMSLTAGYFYDTDNFGAPRGNATALTMRFTGLPYDVRDGARFLHLGFSYSYRDQTENTARFKQQPESYLMPNFVDTKTFSADTLKEYGWEAAFTSGSLTFEGEIILAEASVQDSTENPRFYGMYLEACYAPGGKQRSYDRQRGLYVLDLPKSGIDGVSLSPSRWLFAARVSGIDLDSGSIHGGALTDVTLGANWLVTRNVVLEWNFVLSRLHSEGTARIFQMRFQFFI